eukprot:CAMPEP_0117077578 /NCGR_PEP_ID=MMETSP0472-20121206/54697_1 /TAXON_ID=693140 ORGANISM="Tiarina fusus, Strain LIS" /NCGR_SAMPLE_ID=MMETSP0472 /ASSEMBLY_ACC=CAM_ASM_000603 /LENGTH=135 /DNA_ID=CAMNT_0004803965 /DNA_START=522 /DNA_END=926 /DNA_ORIENTATION=+
MHIVQGQALLHPFEVMLTLKVDVANDHGQKPRQMVDAALSPKSSNHEKDGTIQDDQIAVKKHRLVAVICNTLDDDVHQGNRRECQDYEFKEFHRRRAFHYGKVSNGNSLVGKQCLVPPIGAVAVSGAVIRIRWSV